MNKHFILRGAMAASLLFAGAASFAQAPAKPKDNWQNLDLTADGTFGISTERAYNELLIGKKHIPVLVAVIDGGVDTLHEDLKNILWKNPKEIAGNGKDDDGNGYIDDVHGWGFIGSAKGNVHYDNMELTRVIRRYLTSFAGKDTTALTGKDKADFKEYRKLKGVYDSKLQGAKGNLLGINRFKSGMAVIVSKINKSEPVLADFDAYSPESPLETRVRSVVMDLLPKYKDFKDFVAQVFDEGIKHYQEQIDYHYNLTFDPRDVVGDNYMNSAEHNYGNNDVDGPDADHGSHVSGIIGASRDNGIGIKGVANDVMIMSVRTVPNGDERDKDVANAIRYAAANGAKVINMSFGKSYNWDKKAVDEAVKFAVSKDVLLIHAAGNDNENMDEVVRFPSPSYSDGGEAATWIEVGASGPINDRTLKASFSNYGKVKVDVFAPGVDIYSTVPGSKYDNHSGTSMAAPVVVGLAALIRSYYPNLTALQVKEIILKSVVPVTHRVNLKDGERDRSVNFADLCKTGGIVNAYNALKLAATY